MADFSSKIKDQSHQVTGRTSGSALMGLRLKCQINPSFQASLSADKRELHEIEENYSIMSVLVYLSGGHEVLVTVCTTWARSEPRVQDRRPYDPRTILVADREKLFMVLIKRVPYQRRYLFRVHTHANMPSHPPGW